MKRTLFSILIFFVFGCGGTQPKNGSVSPHQAETSSVAHQESALSDDEEQGEISYVVVYKTTPLYFEPSSSSEFVQFISPSEQSEFESKVRREESQIRKKERQLVREQTARQKEIKRKKRERDKKRKKRRKKRRKRKKRKKKTKKQKDRERRRAALKKEKTKARKLMVKRKVAKKKIGNAYRRVKNRLPDGDIISFFAFRKLKSKGAWIQVETISKSSDIQHCHQGAMDRLGDIKLRFWIKKGDVSEVISRSVSVEVEGGSRVNLKPGLGILEGEYVFVDGFRLKLNLHRDSISNHYQPLRANESPITDTVFSEIGLAQGLSFGKQKLPINPFHSKYVSQTLQIGRKNYAGFLSRCSEVFVQIGKNDIERSGPRKTARFSAGEFGEESAFIRAGSEIRTPKGSKIGVALHDFAVQSQDSKGCFTMQIWKGRRGKRSVKMCAFYE